MWSKLIEFLRGSSSTYEKMFKKSIEMAREAGVPEDQILKSIAEIDSYFLEKTSKEED